MEAGFDDSKVMRHRVTDFSVFPTSRQQASITFPFGNSTSKTWASLPSSNSTLGTTASILAALKSQIKIKLQ